MKAFFLCPHCGGVALKKNKAGHYFTLHTAQDFVAGFKKPQSVVVNKLEDIDRCSCLRDQYKR
jgi:hypothetical protein